MTSMIPARHLVNLSAEGRLQPTGALHTPAAQLHQVFDGLAESKLNSLTIFFHSGLTDDRTNLEISQDLYGEIREQCRSYPVFFGWGTGLLATLQRQMLDILTCSPLFLTRYRKLLKHAARKALPPSDLLAVLEREAFPLDDLGGLARGDALTAGKIAAVSAEDIRALQADLAGDGETAQLLPAVEVLKAAIRRLREGTDHGLTGTVLEELYRQLYADKIGAFLWDEVKANAHAAYAPNPGGAPSDDFHGGALFVELLGQYMAKHEPPRINLIGYSAGAIHLCHFVEHAAKMLAGGFVFDNVILLAPAANFSTFHAGIVTHAKRIKALRLFTMSDAHERQDPLVKLAPVAYPHSLLYLVSGLLERDGPDTPLMGLARHLEGERYAGDETVAAGRQCLRQFCKNDDPPAVVLAPTAEEAPTGWRARFTSHSGKTGGPAYDRSTLESLASMLRPVPERGLKSFSLNLPVADDEMRKLFTPLEPAPTPGMVAKNIIGEDDTVTHAVVDGLLRRGRAVARIVTNGVDKLGEIPPDQRAKRWQEAEQKGQIGRFHGTGWILGQARRVLITNNHVLPLPEAAEDAEAEFGYEASMRAPAGPQRVIRLDPDALYLTSPNMAFGGLDYTLVALREEAPEEFGYLAPTQGVTADAAKSIYVVQHPRGDPKSYIVNHNRKVNTLSPYLTYTSDTDIGSSGSPLFDDTLRLVGIHHLGGYRVKIGGREELTNLGSRIEAVVDDIIQQLRAKGWDAEQVAHWFGGGYVLNTWKLRTAGKSIPVPNSQEDTVTNQFTNGYALLIAVNENKVPKWALPVVGKDVEALAQVLTHPQRCAYAEKNVKIVSGANATRQGILDGLTWLTERLGADTSGNATAVIYYSGHGWRDTSTSSPAYYLIPYDIRENAARLTALRAEDFAAEVEGLTPKRLLVILDCCHAGGMEVKEFDLTARAKGPATVAPSFASSAIPSGLFMGGQKAAAFGPVSKGLQQLAQGAGRAVLSSSQGDQSSYVRKDGVMSIFTYHLIEALTGHAQPAEGANDVRVFNLGDYVDRHVPESAQADCGAQQTPDFQISGNFPVALLLGGKGLSKGMAAPDPLAPLAAAAPAAAFDQRGQTVHGPQTNIAGDMHGPVFSGEFRGPVAVGGGEAVDMRGAQGVVYKPSGPVKQQFGDRINITGDGNVIGQGSSSHVTKHTGSGDQVLGDKVGRDKIDRQINTGGGDFVGRDQIKATGGSAVSTGGSAALVGDGNTVITGKVRGDVRVTSTVTRQEDGQAEFVALLQQISRQLAALASPMDRTEAAAEMAKAEELAQRPEPPAGRIVRALENVREILESSAGAATAVASLGALVVKAIQVAQSLWR